MCSMLRKEIRVYQSSLQDPDKTGRRIRSFYSIKCTKIHKIIGWFGLEGTLKDHLVKLPLPWAGTFFTRSGCSKPCST